ncbi:MAG: thioredoxin-dependent thiol peroxidase [Bacteroidota bacterium]
MTTLNIGDKAPEINVLDQDGNPVSLADFKGFKVIIYFYPKDNTPGCTAQACNLRDNYDLLLKQGYKILGVSADSQKSHQGFISKFDLPFPLVADVDKKMLMDYGVFGPKKFMGKVYDGIHRTTFVVDENGSIARIIKDVDTKNHTKQILEG